MPEPTEELIRKMDELRTDIKALLSSLNRADGQPYDGMASAFREQIGRSFLEQNRTAMRDAIGGFEGAPPRSQKVLSQMTAQYEDAIDRFEKDDLNEALARLEGLRESIVHSPEEVLPAPMASTLLGVVERAREQMALAETLRFRVGRPMVRRSCEIALGGVEPEDAERWLAPLASAPRLRIMAMLYTGPRPFTEMMKGLEMQKGHLRFHLNKLLEAGYVKVEGRTHLYCIEERGYAAMKGLSGLLAQIRR